MKLCIILGLPNIITTMKEEKYLDAMIELFKAEGIELSMDAIADRIGVTRKTLYNRFKSKDELLERCLQRLTNDFVHDTDCLVDESVDVAQGFRDGILGMWKFFCNSSHVFTRDMLSFYPGIANSQHKSGKALSSIKIKANIERGQANGRYRKEIDADLMSKYIAFSIFAFFHNELMKGKDNDFEDYFNKVIDYNLHALLVK